ncbi:oxidative stress-induced growth inhibitor 2 [Diachasma alloeum]|uniref:oxidative stress-induced growth inhibitor 2 n=1 Tax=Diachasma alloeum TaxID=454923 RepID=UPI000738358A|nr:oxidative stress-induced growth inhibitor 2 [Diachasma alloeum]XP_015109035.1 oxidative stress-induced growth inhibitor 2 [Diachasma alloeum]XP_015109036.1 oxidative stress-induced growth inhibitor 2 [Diachasma alloeum]XP_015109037.1 oxidative stress-induced growth inhibitor 2 [Diachasma alloeum]
MVAETTKMEELSNGEDDCCVYKDVVVVGNGPGGICISYMLNGNWPYYTGQPHPGDEMLTARLNYIVQNSRDDSPRSPSRVNPGNPRDNSTGATPRSAKNPDKSPKDDRRSLLLTSRSDLEVLTNGLEGRGTCRPMTLLLDQLQHPCVDAGLDIPSLLSWQSAEHHPQHRVIDHVVLGKGPPGGAWHFMDPNVLTISLTRWMSLPGLDLRKWETLVEKEQLRKSTILRERIRKNCWSRSKGTFEVDSRIPVGTVAAYYKDYVSKMGLTKYFKCGRTVTSVRPLPDASDLDEGYEWIVQGYENQSGRKFKYKCKKVVLATGTTNSSNRLGLPGEETQPSWVTHDLNDLETRLDRLAGKCSKCSLIRKDYKPEVAPVLVIGAGLSAADAIMAARFRSIPVIHAFRDSPSTAEGDKVDNENDNGVRLSQSAYERLQTLPVSMYPEYHKVYEMMADGRCHRLYKALPGYNLIDVEVTGSDCNKKKERRVFLKGPKRQIVSFTVSIVAILIGSKPDLSYLGDLATQLGKQEGKLINGRSNPIEIDDYTYEVVKSPKKGLYAIGPLVGDNFVRFIHGGAFGVVGHLLRTLETD